MNLQKHPLYAHILDTQIPKSLQKPQKLKEYDGKRDPNDHQQLVDEHLSYLHANEAA